MRSKTRRGGKGFAATLQLPHGPGHQLTHHLRKAARIVQLSAFADNGHVQQQLAVLFQIRIVAVVFEKGLDLVPDPEIVVSAARELERIEANRLLRGKFTGYRPTRSY